MTLFYPPTEVNEFLHLTFVPISGLHSHNILVCIIIPSINRQYIRIGTQKPQITPHLFSPFMNCLNNYAIQLYFRNNRLQLLRPDRKNTHQLIKSAIFPSIYYV